MNGHNLQMNETEKLRYHFKFAKLADSLNVICNETAEYFINHTHLRSSARICCIVLLLCWNGRRTHADNPDHAHDPAYMS